jgi:hypothetical protein
LRVIGFGEESNRITMSHLNAFWTILSILCSTIEVSHIDISLILSFSSINKLSAFIIKIGHTANRSRFPFDLHLLSLSFIEDEFILSVWWFLFHNHSNSELSSLKFIVEEGLTSVTLLLKGCLDLIDATINARAENLITSTIPTNTSDLNTNRMQTEWLTLIWCSWLKFEEE